ncbi:MAG TPA: TonB-dependent receptor [Caulobacteraceae bacterium]|jgi:iron complex outermembrane receptor protein
MRLLRKYILLSSAASVLAATAAPALAADAAAAAVDSRPPVDTSVNEVVVTARRTNERAQDVPIALSVVGGAALERTGAYTTYDLQQQTPSLTVFNSNPRNSSIGVRGIGVSSASDGLDTSVGVYVDNVYLGRPGMSLADLVDVDRVEVLRGPQGTLFGRNNSAGVLNIATRKPEFEPGADVEASLGDYAYNQERISLTGPLVDGKLAFRASGFNTYRNGVLTNQTTGIPGNSVDRSGARLQLLATPNDRLTVRLIGDYSVENDTCCVGVTKVVLPTTLNAATANTFKTLNALGYVPAASTDSTRNNAPQDMRTDQKGVSLQADYDLGWATATSISAWRYWHFAPLQDSDGTPLDVIQVNAANTRDDQVSEELRLASKPGRFTWQVGAYAFHQRLEDHYILNQFGTDASAFYTAYARLTNPNAAAISIAPGSQYLDDVASNADSVAVFGQANDEVTDRLTVTVGVRYTHDRRTGVSDTSTYLTPNASTSIPFHYNVVVSGDNASWLGSVSYRLHQDVLAYVSYSTGYKGAGLNLNSAVTPGTPLVLQPENTRNWEAGLKSQVWDRRITLNLNAFWTELTGLQANIYPSNGARSYLANVGNVRSRGIELDGSIKPDRHLTLSVDGAYDDAVYTRYPNGPCPVGVSGVCDLTGAPVFQAPRWIGNAAVDWRFDPVGKAQPYVLAQYSYRSSAFGTVDDSRYGLIPAYGVANFRVGASFAEGKYDLSIWANNAFDARYFQNLSTTSIVGTSPFAFAGQLGTPRTVGGTVRAYF